MKPLTHEERQALIRQPFRCQRIPPKSWGGALISYSTSTHNTKTGEYDREWGRVHQPVYMERLD